MTDYEKLTDFLQSSSLMRLHHEASEDGLGHIVTFYTAVDDKDCGSHVTLEFKFDEKTGQLLSTEEK